MWIKNYSPHGNVSEKKCAEYAQSLKRFYLNYIFDHTNADTAGNKKFVVETRRMRRFMSDF
jgi:hypothetical protein